VEASSPFRFLSLDEFVERLSSADPTPGGGSASAVAASLGASLVAMVAALSEDRPRYEQHAALLQEVRERAQTLASRFLTLADEDAAAYGEFSAALKLPRESESEQGARKAAIRQSARVAAAVPFRCVEACHELASLAEVLAGRSNRNASSDLEVASLLALAAAKGAAANVMVNLPAIEDDPAAGEMMGRVKELVNEMTRLVNATKEQVRSGAARDPLPPRRA
jgi:methenyltetrahydrofolate cyclohydrolase